jgi:Na+-driven multidrug efflux pump
MGVRGAACATIISQALSVIISFVFFLKGNFNFKFTKANFVIVWNLVGKYVRIGVPIGVQSILINISFLFIVSIVNKMGGSNPACAAGYGIVSRINGFTMLPAISFAMAMSALTAQNIGAKKYLRAVKTLYTALTFTMILGVIFLAGMQLCPEFFISLFIDKSNPESAEVISQGVLYARSFSIEYILVPIVFCTNGFFVGSGHAMFSMINNLTSTFILRVPVSYFASLITGATLFHIGLAAPMASLFSAIVALIFLFSGKWKKQK